MLGSRVGRHSADSNGRRWTFGWPELFSLLSLYCYGMRYFMLLRFHIPINPRYLRHYHCRLQRSMAAVCCQRADIYLLRVQASLRRIRTKRRYSPVFSSDAAQARCKRDRKPCRLYSELPSVLRCAGSYIDDETFLYSGLLSVGGLHEQLSTAGLQSIPAQYRRYRDHVGSTNEGKVSNNDRTHLPDRKMVSGFRKFRCVVVHILQVNCHLCVPERNRLPSKTTTSYHFTSPHGRIGNASLIPCRVHNICVLPYNIDISFTSLPTVITSTSNLPFYYLKVPLMSINEHFYRNLYTFLRTLAKKIIKLIETSSFYDHSNSNKSARSSQRRLATVRLLRFGRMGREWVSDVFPGTCSHSDSENC